MTRLPMDTWDVTPRPDLEPYELNTVCPVTGQEANLEDHHIWRRSFTALGKEGNEALFWVQVGDWVLPNRVALGPDVHRKITWNEARIFIDDEGVFFYEDSEMTEPLNPQPGPQGKLLATGREHDHLKPGEVCRSCGRKMPYPRKKNDAPRQRTTLSLRVPLDERENGAEVLETLWDEARKELKEEMGWQDDVPVYYVQTAVFADWLNSRKQS